MSQLFSTSQNYTMTDTQQVLAAANQTINASTNLTTPDLFSQVSQLTAAANLSTTSRQKSKLMNNQINSNTNSSNTTAEYMKWTDSEVTMLLQWLKKPENMDLFFNKKKVTAIKKIRELLQSKTERQIKNKLASLENNYKKTKQKLLSNWDFTTTTQQDSETFSISEEKIKRTCPFYDELDEIFGSYSNVIQSPINVDLTNASNAAAVALVNSPANTTRATDHTIVPHDNSLTNLSTNNTGSERNIDPNSVNQSSAVQTANEIILENAKNQMNKKFFGQAKKDFKKNNAVNPILLDNNLSSLLHIIDGCILQRGELLINKINNMNQSNNTLSEQALLLKERYYDKKLQSRERQMERKQKMFEMKMKLKEKELDIRKYEAEVRMEEIKLKKLIHSSCNNGDPTNAGINNNNLNLSSTSAATTMDNDIMGKRRKLI